MHSLKSIKLPSWFPGFIEVPGDRFIASDNATTADWRAAALKLCDTPLTEAERKSVLTSVRQIVKIADMISAPEDAILLPMIRAYAASNVTTLSR